MSARSYEQGHFNTTMGCGYTHSILRTIEIHLFVPRVRLQTHCLIVQERHGPWKTLRVTNRERPSLILQRSDVSPFDAHTL
jgi:hypothetical protein